MIAVRRADKFVVRDVEHIAEPADRSSHIVHKRLWRHARFRRLELDLLSVLVRSGLEKDIVAVLSLVARYAVRQHDLVVVSDMRLAGSVRYCRCDIVFTFILHYRHHLSLSILIK